MLVTEEIRLPQIPKAPLAKSGYLLKGPTNVPPMHLKVSNQLQNKKTYWEISRRITSKVANPKHPQTTNNLQSYQVLKPSPNGFAWFSRPSIGLSWEQNLEMEDRIRSIRSHV